MTDDFFIHLLEKDNKDHTKKFMYEIFMFKKMLRLYRFAIDNKYTLKNYRYYNLFIDRMLDLLEDQKLVIEEMSKQFDIQDFDLKDVLFSRTEKDRHTFTSFDRDLHVKEIIKLANAFKGMTSSK